MRLKKFSRLSRVIYRPKLKHLYFLLAPLLVWLLLASLKIKKIECWLNDLPCPERIVQKLDVLIGKNLLLLSEQKIISSLGNTDPVTKQSLVYRPFNKIVLKLKNSQDSIAVNTFYLLDLPDLSINNTLLSSQSAIYTKPTQEIEDFLSDKPINFAKLWSGGNLVSDATAESNINLIISQNPTPTLLSDIFRLLKLVSHYLNFHKAYIINNQIFLSQTDQPDIITLVPFDEDVLKQAFSSIGYLTSIKQDPKILDFRFRNPIVR